jgi:hypothetical protein
MAGVLVRTDYESQVSIPKDYARWMTVCQQCRVAYNLAYSKEEAILERRAVGTFNTRDQLMADASIAVTREHPSHRTELFLWGPEKEWQSIEIVKD